MITEWFIALAVSMAGWVADLFPDDDAPDWVTGLPGQVNGLFDRFHGMGGWIDTLTLGIIFGVVIGWWGAGFLIKGIRALIGHVPEFGGNG